MRHESAWLVSGLLQQTYRRMRVAPVVRSTRALTTAGSFTGDVCKRCCSVHGRTAALQGILLASRLAISARVLISYAYTRAAFGSGSAQVAAGTGNVDPCESGAKMHAPAGKCSRRRSPGEDRPRRDVLEQHGQVYTLQLKPNMVRISPLNRDGSGVNPVEVHELLSDILTADWTCE